MKIETGKYYRTRGGLKIGPIMRRHVGSLPYAYAIGENSGCWFHDGRHHPREETQFDLVAEWVDEPAPVMRFEPAPYYLVHGAGPTNYRHPTRAAALIEATRLAGLHPGTAFSVMKSTDRVIIPVGEPEVTRYAGQDAPECDDKLGGIPF